MANHRSRLLRRVVVVVGATLAAFGVWLIFDPLAGVDLVVPDGPGSDELHRLTPERVLAAAGVASLAAWALLETLERVVRPARRLWTVIALVVLVVSMASPLFGVGLSVTNRIALILMHLTVAVVLIPGLPAPSTPRSAASREAISTVDR